MEHAYFSPSASSRWLNCPASLFLCESQKPQGYSSYAHEGVVCHDIAAQCLIKGVLASTFAGEVIDKVAITPELVDAIQMYADEIRGLTKEYQAIGGKIEHKVKLTENCWGTSDAVLWNKDTLLVCDLKMGKGVVVSADDNSQLKIYSIGSLKWLAEEHKITPKKIVNIIIQPRTPNPIRRYEISYSELAEWGVKKVTPILVTIKPGKDSGLDCNPGETQCKWCPVSATCAAQAGKIMTDAQNAFAPYTKVKAPETIAANKRILEISDAAEYKKVFTHIQQWMKNINTFLMDSALRGETIPGFKLVEGRANRKWAEDETYIADFLKQLDTEPYIQKLVSPAQAEKVLGKKKTKENNLASLIIKPKGEPKLVVESDKRPKMELDSETIKPDFEDFVPSVDTADIPETILVADTKKDTKVRELSALQRMRLAPTEDSESPTNVPSETPLSGDSESLTEMPSEGIVVDLFGTPEPSGFKAVVEAEIATSGDLKCVERVLGRDNPTPPGKTTKRYEILNFGKGENTLHRVSQTLNCSINMIKMHLRYLNERDGYTYEVYSDGTFKIY